MRSRARASPAALLLLFCASPSPAADLASAPHGAPLDRGLVTANLVPNPSLELGRGEAPQGWSFRGEGEGTWDAREASHGRRSVRVDRAGAWLSDAIPLAPGLATLFSARSRSRGGGRWGTLARIDILDRSGNVLDNLAMQIRDEHGWTRMQVSGVTPPGTASGVVRCYVGQEGVRAWFDEIDVRQWTDGLPQEWAPGGFPPTVVGFDLGTAHSAVADGFRAVDPSTVYLARVGYGWTAQTQMDGRDQIHGSFRPSALDDLDQPVDRHRTLLDALTRDYVRGVGAAGFRVDLARGRYSVFLLAGHSGTDEAPPYFDLVISLNGQRAGRLQKRFPGPAFDWNTFPVEVGDQGLQIGLSSDRFGGAWALSAIVIFPESAADEGRRLVDSCVRSVEILPHDLLEKVHRVPSPWLSPMDPPIQDFPPGLQLLRGDWPSAGEPASSLSGRASPGLSVDFRFALRTGPEQDAEGVRFTLDPFATAEGSILPGDSATLWYVRERAVRRAWGFAIHDQYSLEPDELDRRLPDRLVAGASYLFWLRVRLPADTPGGVYRSTLRVDVSGETQVRIPLMAEALRFPAVEPRLFQNPYLHMSAGTLSQPATVGVAEEAERLRVRAVADIADHLGDPAVFLNQLPVVQRQEGRWEIEREFLRERVDAFRGAAIAPQDAVVALPTVLRQLARALAPQESDKFGKHFPDVPNLPPAFWEALGDVIEQIDGELRDQGITRRVYIPWDEALGADLTVFAQVARVLRERLPEPRIFCNVPPNTYFGGPTVGAENALAPHCNTWWVYGTLTDAQRATERARGTWLMGGFVPEGPTEARAASGLLRWRRQEMGGNWWSYDAVRGSANTHLDGPSWGDRCLAYPTADLSPRLAWEATRMGHEDLRYILTLESWSRDTGMGRVGHRAARKARRLLDELHVRIDPTVPDPLAGPDEYDGLRDRVLDALIELHAARVAAASGD